MSKLSSLEIDGQTNASKSIAWLIVFNKPFYPLYVWWLTEKGLEASLWMLLSAPLYACLPWLARRNSFWLRAGVPLLGTCDTVLAQTLFGDRAAAGLFLLPCALLLGLALRTSEAHIVAALTAAGFLLVAASRLAPSMPIYLLSTDDLAAVANLHFFSATGLAAFILWRFSRVQKP
jgi:hypothetical protein